MTTLDREERLLLTQLARAPLPTWALSGMLLPNWMAAFNQLHHKGLVTLAADYLSYGASDAGRAALMAGHGLSFFDMCYRAEDDEEFSYGSPR